jgi:hypothetical protein
MIVNILNICKGHAVCKSRQLLHPLHFDMVFKLYRTRLYPLLTKTLDIFTFFSMFGIIHTLLILPLHFWSILEMYEPN